jgi:hypothetical protein
MRASCVLKATTMIFLLWGTSSGTLATNIISQSTTAGLLDSSLGTQASHLSGIYLSAFTSMVENGCEYLYRVVDSTRRCNTGIKFICWRFKI